MDRRRFIVSLGIIWLPGCLRLADSEDTKSPEEPRTRTKSPSPTPSPSPFPSPTPSPTTEEEELTIVLKDTTEFLHFPLISDWQEFGDIEENKIEEISPDQDALIGVQVRVRYNEDNETRWSNKIEISDDDDVVSPKSEVNEDFTNNCDGTVLWEQALSFRYQGDSNWRLGMYSAEVVIDAFYGEKIVSDTTTFEVVE